MNKQIIVIRNFIVNAIKKFGIREKILLNSFINTSLTKNSIINKEYTTDSNINKQILLKSIVELEKDDG